MTLTTYRSKFVAWAIVLGLVGLTAACGGSTKSTPPQDAPPAEPDALIDAPLDAPGTSRVITLEPLSAATRVQGGTITMDVELGHSITPTTINGSTYTLEGGSVTAP